MQHSLMEQVLYTRAKTFKVSGSGRLGRIESTFIPERMHVAPRKTR